jgi:hypothetical protein
MPRFTFLVCMALSPLSLLLLPRLPTVMTRFSLGVSHTALLWFRVMVMPKFLSRAPVYLAFPPPLLLFALDLPCRLAAVAHALLGMVNSVLLLLLLPVPLILMQSALSPYNGPPFLMITSVEGCLEILRVRTDPAKSRLLVHMVVLN